MGGCSSSTGTITTVSNGVKYTCTAFSFQGPTGIAIRFPAPAVSLVGDSLRTLQYKVQVVDPTVQSIYVSQPCGYTGTNIGIDFNGQAGEGTGGGAGAAMSLTVPAFAAGVGDPTIGYRSTAAQARGSGTEGNGGLAAGLFVNNGATFAVAAGGGAGSADLPGGSGGTLPPNYYGQDGTSSTLAGEGAGGSPLTGASQGNTLAGGSSSEPNSYGGGAGYYAGQAGTDGSGGGGGASYIDTTVVTSSAVSQSRSPLYATFYFAGQGCVAETQPTGQMRTRRRAARRARRRFFQQNPFCPPSQRACPTVSGGHECIEKTELSQCGGCASLGEGTDCTALPGYLGVACLESGRCVSTSSTCMPGFMLNPADECVAT